MSLFRKQYQQRLKNFEFGPRTFKRRADDKSGIGSIWTDTVADREKSQVARKKTTLSKGSEESVLSGRDKRLAEQVTSYNVSVTAACFLLVHFLPVFTLFLTKHQERRPFDREQDLKVNRFDEAQKKALIRKSRDLNSKFEHSKGNMFL
uniref:GPALPP motifs-containing protein 1 n=1 Tax=Anser brachyrhynchus TaxID=132585 RepID=A0A8B9BN44_9AVES